MPILARRERTMKRGDVFVLNAPYAGGFTTGHYGNPRRSRHAVQIEINRMLYMDEATLEKHGGFATLQQRLSRFLGSLQSFIRARL